MSGLKIRTITGAEFVMSGPVTYQDYADGRVYYCAGSSYPEEVVVEVYEE